ncbi:MAG: sigma-70 family RNA polymerase sigma factor [Acidimicrobiia bacterium]|nr:sigma-70 family RNA polymerase sigma factor [Acidimicrobiia bacterium]
MGIATEPERRYRNLFERHHCEVYAYCRRRTDAETAADCFAETFLVAWRRLDDVPDGDAALGWLYGVARRVLANEFRRTRRSRRLLTRLRDTDTGTNPGPDVVVVRNEEDRIMFQALGRLRTEDQELLRLAWWEELPHVTIADVLGCSPNAATHRIQRAAQRVAKEYQRLDRTDKPTATHRQPSGGGSI